MDFLRIGYTRRCKFFRSTPGFSANIIWYPVPPGTPLYPYPHNFASIIYNSNPDADDDVGEQLSAPLVWRGDVPVPMNTTGDPEGDLLDFLGDGEPQEHPLTDCQRFPIAGIGALIVTSHFDEGIVLPPCFPFCPGAGLSAESAMHMATGNNRGSLVLSCKSISGLSTGNKGRGSLLLSGKSNFAHFPGGTGKGSLLLSGRSNFSAGRFGKDRGSLVLSGKCTFSIH